MKQVLVSNRVVHHSINKGRRSPISIAVISALLCVSAYSCGCASSERSKCYPWNMDNPAFFAAVDAARANADAGSDSAIRDLFWLEYVSDTERSGYTSYAIDVLLKDHFDRIIDNLNREPYYVRQSIAGAIVQDADDATVRDICKRLNIQGI